MTAVVEIIAAIVAIYCAARIGLAVAGAIIVSVRERRYAIVAEEESTTERYETGFSVAVIGVQSVEQIRRRLSMDYNAYEVIVVGDFDSSTEMDEVLRTYRMVRMRLRDEEMRRCGHIEIYRSRQRRYRRLIVANRVAAGNNDKFDCATVIASYDKIIRLDADTFLHRDALRRFSFATEHAEHRRVVGAALCSLKTDAASAIDRATRALFSAVIPQNSESVEVVERDELTEQSRKCRRPRVPTLSVGAVAETSVEARGIRSGRTTVVLVLLGALTGGIAFAEGGSNDTGLLLLAALCLYAAFVTSGVLAIAIVAVEQNGEQGSELSNLSPKTLILYPFKHLWHTITGWKCRLYLKKT